MPRKPQKPLKTIPVIYRHLVRNIFIATAAIIISLLIGMIGYHHSENMSWVDSFLNASMILSGMGPANEMHTEEGKIFAGCYALFSGLAFIAFIALFIAPMVHKFLSKLHLETKDERFK